MFDRFRATRPPRRNKSAKPPGYRHKRRETRRDLYDWITLWTAIIGVTLVCVGTGVTAYQAVVMRDELRQTREQQRAWLRAEVSPTGPLAVAEDGAILPVVVRVTNVGAVPATGVMSQSKLVAFAPPGETPVKRTRDESSCPEKLAYMDGRVGNSVFPGETVDLPMEAPRAPTKQIGESTRGGAVTLILMVCVGYNSGGAGERSTEFVSVVLAGEDGSGRWPLGQVRQPQDIIISRIGAAEKAD